jgi:hypothetical protein
VAKAARNKVFMPSTEDKKAVFHNSLWYEIVFTFGVPAHDPTDYCQWEAINFSRMGHARVLYTFLETKTENRSQDDVLAEDYGFPAESINLPSEDRRRLNKDLFHLTYARLRHTPATKPWPDNIISNLLEPCLKFMEHISNQRDLFDTDAEFAGWIDLMRRLRSGRELQISCTVDSNNRPNYTLTLGSELPGGRPALTRCYPTGGLGEPRRE